MNEKVTFNEDFSGHYEMTINMSQMIVFMEEMVAEMESAFAEMAEEEGESQEEDIVEEEESDEPGQAELMTEGFMSGITSGFEDVAAEIDSLEDVLGVENMDFLLDSTTKEMKIVFDFPDLKSLGNFYQSFRESMNEDEMSLEEKPKVKDDFEWIVLKGNKLIFKGDPEASVGDDPAAEMMEGMNESITISSEYSFAKKIKSVNHPFAKVDGNKVNISVTLQQMDDHKLASKDLVIEFEK